MPARGARQTVPPSVDRYSGKSQALLAAIHDLFENEWVWCGRGDTMLYPGIDLGKPSWSVGKLLVRHLERLALGTHCTPVVAMAYWIVVAPSMPKASDVTLRLT
ncbi:MAG TPA: hypothetical protein VHZ74_12980 [Bryobacteraceae bacterium]|nr:hypothetical protein [Bryobacteraceae bacterium]